MGDWRYMPHSAVGVSTEDTVVGVPSKGRNAGIALRNELERDDTDEILDILNGRGKTASKTGEGFTNIWKDVQNYDFIELEDTGRKFPRPVFTEVDCSKGKVRSWEEEPLESNFDRFYQGFDRVIEENYDSENISGSFESLSKEIAEQNGYELIETYGKSVNWGVMNSDLDVNPDLVLLPEDFQKIGKAVAESYWDIDPDYTTFSNYASRNNLEGSEEEEILSVSPEKVGGSYMFVSGKSADREGLEKYSESGFESRLGEFEVIE